ncbi:hypothetical protein DW842_20570 [Ruminococcus sp. AM36-17]|nr:hypothetical protein DW842_20570 [Ruminococcus sp. AM36-17]
MRLHQLNDKARTEKSGASLPVEQQNKNLKIHLNRMDILHTVFCFKTQKKIAKTIPNLSILAYYIHKEERLKKKKKRKKRK